MSLGSNLQYLRRLSKNLYTKIETHIPEKQNYNSSAAQRV